MNKEAGSALADKFVDTLRKVVGPNAVPLHEPVFIGNEWDYLKECINSTYVSSVGKYVDRFEIDLANYTGAKYAISVVNGTSALHIALKLVGVESNNEILVPALTFVATANAVTYCGAIPHFVDSEEYTLGIDALKLREYLSYYTEQYSDQCVNTKSGKIISAMVPMHTFGHPADMDKLLAISHDFNITLVEDAAESLGSYYHGKHTGTFGKVGILSFNGNKTITTGGGGAIITNDYEIAVRAKHLTTTAKLPHDWEYYHDEIGYNYRMPNLNAALGCAQLENLPKMLLAKRKLFERYQMQFRSFSELTLFSEPQNCTSNYWLQTIILDRNHISERDIILKLTNDSGIMTRPAWVPLNKLKHFKNCPQMETLTAQMLSERIINIPSSSNLV